MSSERVKLTLRVLEAEPKDVGKGIGRVDPEVLERTGLMNGDIVIIEGKRRTVVRVMESKPQDRGLGVIRIDNTTRQNAGVKIGDLVIVEKTEAANAVSIKLAPSKYYAPPDSQLADFVKNKLLNRPLIEEDIVVVPVLGQTIPFKVIYTKPKGPVVVTKDTIVTISEKPMETYRLPRVTYEDIGGMKHIIQRVRELIEL
ncbi:MAG: AAA family ATPase, partial [Thermogladius sp.]